MKSPRTFSATIVASILLGFPAIAQAIDCPGPGCPLGPSFNSTAFPLGALFSGAIISCARTGCERTEVSRRSAQPASVKHVKRVQEALAFLGFEPGVADGLIGKRTRAAISAFQSSLGEPPTGRLTPLQTQLLWREYQMASAPENDSVGAVPGDNTPSELPAFDLSPPNPD